MTRKNRSQRTMERRRRTSRGVLVIAGTIVSGILAFSFFFDDMGVRKYLAMREHARMLEQDIRDLEEANAELRRDIDRVQHDPARIEELARERLGFVRKGETVYQILEDEAPSATRPAVPR